MVNIIQGTYDDTICVMNSSNKKNCVVFIITSVCILECIYNIETFIKLLSEFFVTLVNSEQSNLQY